MASLDFRVIKYSIVNTITTESIKKDRYSQYQFIDFVKNLSVYNASNEFVIDAYNKYLIEWSRIKKIPVSDFTQQRKDKYIALLKNIQLNYTTDDERRILGNIDYDNPLELEVAIPFFVEKIKDIIEYYIRKRRDVKNSKYKWKTKGNKKFLEKSISEYIFDNYIKTDNTFQSYKQDYQPLSSFQKNYIFKYNGLYDLNNYWTDHINIDTTTFLSSDSDYNIEELPLSSFSDYTNDSELNDTIKKNLFKKYISNNYQYNYNNETINIDSTTPFYNQYNDTGAYISNASLNDNLKSNKDI